MTTPKTLFEKVWSQHIVREEPGVPAMIYIDLQLIHEVTSPQAFDGLRARGLRVRRPDRTFATMDHSTPTLPKNLAVIDPQAEAQLAKLTANCKEFGIELFDARNTAEQGIVHVIGPELGLTQPGMTIVCGDSHTSTHGAFGALAFGIGTSEVEHVARDAVPPADETEDARDSRRRGSSPAGVGGEGRHPRAHREDRSTGGRAGHVIEYAGQPIRALDMEERMTVCNMSIEAGARAGMIAPDDTTFAVSRGPTITRRGARVGRCGRAWRALRTDDGATFDREVTLDASKGSSR
jgi:3-isopropylmalate/(R)-2-methylmalate dehydratase large subunit